MEDLVNMHVNSDWVVKLPDNMTLEAMIYGTAGYTAGLAIEKLEKLVL